jgi:hypothetical protein
MLVGGIAALLLGASATSASATTFSGDCAFTGTSFFFHPYTLVPEYNDYLSHATGTCTGTLDGSPYKGPGTLFMDGRMNSPMSCETGESRDVRSTLTLGNPPAAAPAAAPAPAPATTPARPHHRRARHHRRHGKRRTRHSSRTRAAQASSSTTTAQPAAVEPPPEVAMLMDEGHVFTQLLLHFAGAYNGDAYGHLNWHTTTDTGSQCAVGSGITQLNYDMDFHTVTPLYG